jgi:hypothetical protein
LREQHDFLFDWLWMDGLTNAVDRGPATQSFPAYLAALQAQSPTALRDRLVYWFLHSPHGRVWYEYRHMVLPEPAVLLADYATFCTFLEDRGGDNLDELNGVAAMFALFNNPPQLQTTLVTHLQTLWDDFLAVEWQRIEPKLQATVTAFSAVRLEGLAILEAMQVITGRDLRPVFRLDTLLAYRRIRFIPHLHNGPYVIWFGDHEELRLGFPAHQPSFPVEASRRFDLVTLTNRCNALADEIRLAILLALRGGQELSTQEVIEQFDLDKSAASRHLRQLVATSLIEERRVDGAKKVYRVNRKAVDELMEFLASLD